MLGKDQLIKNLLDLNNNPFNPYVVTYENDKIVATWNLVDKNWVKVFAKAGMKKTHKIIISFIQDKNQVKYTEQTNEVNWNFGLPIISYSQKKTFGKSRSFKRSMALSIKNDLTLEKVYDYKYSSEKLKQPIFKVITDAGWKIKRSWLDKLLGF